MLVSWVCPGNKRLVVQWEKVSSKRVRGIRETSEGRVSKHDKALRAGNAKIYPTKRQYVIPLKK